MRRDIRGSPKFERTDLSQKGKTNNNNNNKVVFGGNQLPENHGGKTRSLRRQKSGLRAKIDIFSQ